MGNVATKKSLAFTRARLVEIMQDINFGRITFHVRDGEPDFSQMYRTLRTVKLSGGENGPRPEANTADFTLRKEHMALMEQMAGLADGTRLTVKVKHGLPFLAEIEQEHQA